MGRLSATERKKMGNCGDWILRTTGNGNLNEFGAGEVGKKWTDEFDN